LPVPTSSFKSRKSAVMFQVFGKAPNHAFAWQSIKRLIADPEATGADGKLKPEDREDGYLPGDRAEFDLTFENPKPILGKVLDDTDKPIRDVEVTLTICDYLDKSDDLRGYPARGFGVYGGEQTYGVMPDQLTAKTDDRGEFQLPFVPPGVWALLWVEHPDFGTVVIKATSSDVPASEKENRNLPLRKSPLEVRFHHTQALTVLVKAAGGGPVEGASVLANPKEQPGVSGQGTTDKDGRAILRLPSGRYRLDTFPPIDSDYLPLQEQEFSLMRDVKGQSATMEVETGSVVTFKVIDAGSGKPVAGVSLWSAENRDAAAMGRRDHISSQPSRSDESPVTNEKGEFRAVLKPGPRQVGLHVPAGFAAAKQEDEKFGRGVVLIAGKGKTIEFQLRQLPAKGS
jgi:hypothetical protein